MPADMPDVSGVIIGAGACALSPASMAGLHGGERIVRINERDVAHWGDVRWELLVNLFSDELRIDAESRGSERAYVLTRQIDVSSAVDVGTRLSSWGLAFDQPALIGFVKPGGRAHAVGLKEGDRIVAVGAQPVRQWTQFARAIQIAGEQPLIVTVDRQGVRLDVMVTPRSETVQGRIVGRIDVGALSPLKLGDVWVVERQRSTSESIVASMRRTADASILTVRVLWGMLTGEVSLRQLSGPLTMAEGAGVTLNQGVVAFAHFLAIVSISIGVLNLLPVPMLDGGQLLYHLLEALRGVPLSEHAEALGQRVGIGFVTALTALALYNDFLRIFS